MTEEVMLPQLYALSLSIAVLGAVWAYLALGILASFALVWAGFIAWGCFFHSGGDQKALIKTICGNVYGIFVAWIALLIIFKFGVAAHGLLAIAIVVGVTVFFLVIVAKVDLLSVVPANVYGYAATVAYSLHQASAAGATPDVMGTGPLENLASGSLENPLIKLILSMVIGAVFGYASGWLSGILSKKTA
jgi:Protein of unknown function (DUF1097)